MYKYRHLYVNHSPKYSHSVTLCHRQGRIISGRGQGAKLRAKHANFFLPQLLKILPPPPEGEQGDKCIQSLPKKSMKIHHFARTAKNFMHSSLIFKGEG